MPETEERPKLVYRHLVVYRKGFVATTMPDDIRRWLIRMDGGAELPDSLSPEEKERILSFRDKFYVKDTVSKTVRDTYGADADLDEVPDRELQDWRSREGGKQGGIVVGRIHKVVIPGGDERLPLNPTQLFHPGFRDSDESEAEFMRCAEELREEFRRGSDLKWTAIPEHLRKDSTLVTVVYTPIMAAPKADRGMELFCQYYQKTRMGRVSASDFDVYSETGDFPIAPPGTIEMVTMMKAADEIGGIATADEINRKRIQARLDHGRPAIQRKEGDGIPSLGGSPNVGGAEVGSASGVRLRGGTPSFGGGRFGPKK